MKKMLVCLMALVMLCACTMNVLAEEEADIHTEITPISLEISYEAQALLLAEVGRYVLVPMAWEMKAIPEDMDNPENVMVYVGNADGTILFGVEKAETDMDTLTAALVEAGATEKMLTEVCVNGIYALVYAPDETTKVLYTPDDEVGLLVMTIRTANGELLSEMGDMPLEILGSMGSYVITE